MICGTKVHDLPDASSPLQVCGLERNTHEQVEWPAEVSVRAAYSAEYRDNARVIEVFGNPIHWPSNAGLRRPNPTWIIQGPSFVITRARGAYLGCVSADPSPVLD